MSQDEQRQNKTDRPGWKWSYLMVLVSQLAMVSLVYWSLSSRYFFVPSLVYWLMAALAMLTIVLMALGMMKKNISYIWWEALLLIFAFCGIWILSLAVLPFWAGIILAGLVTLLPYIWPLTLWQDLAFLLGTVGIGLFVAMQFPYSVLLICALGVVIYEYLRSNQAPMATLLAEAFYVGLPPGILLPARFSGWLKPVDQTWQAGHGLVVGFLPLIVISAISLRLAHRGWFWLLALAVLLALGGGLWGQTGKHQLRGWIFLTIAVGFYALVGLFQL